MSGSNGQPQTPALALASHHPRSQTAPTADVAQGRHGFGAGVTVAAQPGGDGDVASETGGGSKGGWLERVARGGCHGVQSTNTDPPQCRPAKLRDHAPRIGEAL